jgi:hypothetical protein
MKKYVILFSAIFILVVLGSTFISAVCCEKLKNSDLWCQDVTSKTQCDLTPGKYTSWDFKICQEVPECKGTCVNGESGECWEMTPKKKCAESKGSWYETSVAEISKCQEICCLIGKDAWFLNPTECIKKFEEFGIQGTMRTDITTRTECEAMQSNIIEGACVISDLTNRTCFRSTNTECTNSNIQELASKLKNPSSINNVNVRFYPGLLCTASIGSVSISDCARSNNTVCKDNRVYFRDLCGNTANIYDKSRYGNQSYWSYIIEDYDAGLCDVTSQGSDVCGNCDTTENTVCESYKNAGYTTKPANNPDGLVCGSMSCKFDVNGDGKMETKEHGESWCAGTAGTLIINRNLTTGVVQQSNLTALRNASKYNLPGSRYYKLICANGEVLVEECGDYRNSICMEGRDDTSKKTEASCVFNTWRTCFGITTRKGCEAENSLCKWIPGYTWTPGEMVAEENRKELQGSCVPLIAPGFDFWNPTGQGNSICGMATVQDAALYETSWTKKRSNFAEWSDYKQSQRCINGCYVIPSYGMEFIFNGTKIYPEDVDCRDGGSNLKTKDCPNNYSLLTEFYDESEFNLEKNIENYHLSDRRGQYCHKDGKPDQWVTGGITGPSYDCTPGVLGIQGTEAKDERKERDYPIYLTNAEWISSIVDRARSLGDCGYKASINGKYSDPETEIITAVFQKLSQKMEVKKNITVEQIIWKGGKYLTGDLEKYETELGVAVIGGGSSCSDKGGICTSTAYNPECTGGTVSTEGTCGEKFVCCVYTELGAE